METESPVERLKNTVPEAKISFYDVTRKDLELMFAGSGKEKYRAGQVFTWVYRQGVTDIEQMTNLSKDFRRELSEKFDFDLPKLALEATSKDTTKKVLIDVGGGKTVESVLIPAEDRLTLCVSSEVGCNMACKFCFTGKQKLQRRLTPKEIVGQFLRAQEVAVKEGKRITNIVFMGMGEPLDNPDAVFKAIDIICDNFGINLSRKKITVSTSGLVPQIPLVLESGVRLAVSLNASNDEIRDDIMPINKKYPLNELMDACREYAHQSGDRVTFEYVLLKGVNDTLEDAKRVHKLVKNVPSKLNLIPFNEHEGADYTRPEVSAVLAFQNELIRLGHTVFIRRTMGRDIYAACGQLRSKFEGHPGWKKSQTVLPQ